MTTLIVINDKLDSLGGEMKKQTLALSGIEMNTKSMATVALADQEARDRIYDRLAEGLLKLARVISCGLIVVLLLALVSIFKQEFHATLGDGSVHMGKMLEKEKPQ